MESSSHQRQSNTPEVKYQKNPSAIRTCGTIDAMHGPITPIVIGCGRGGTTAVAGAIHLLGIPMAQADHSTKELPLNFERNEMHVLKQHMRIYGTASMHQEALTCVTNFNSIYGNRSWGWKDPSCHLYLQEVLPACRNPCFIFVLRSLFDVCASDEAAMNAAGVPFEGQELKGSFKANATKAAILADIVFNSDIPAAFVGFEKVISAPKMFIDNICSFLEIYPAYQQVQNAISFLSAGRGYQRVIED